ncbi:glycosyltransferase involved in cell wall biosynthesis [Flavobacterium sp. W4I14]|nr:glycosyltransferase involved in cell wall biosynthesis [Flavobacterium sp. W4I14]
MSKIALAIPAYNAAWCLPRLLESARKQLIPFEETLVYDDFSSDNTAEIAESYGAIVIRGKINKGCSVGKNILLAQTTCDWIHFHDADDELYPNFNGLAKKWVDKLDCPDVILFDYEYRENNNGEFLSKSDFSREQLRNNPIPYAILNQINPFCGLYNVAKLRAIGGYDTQPEILFNEDVAFHCKLAIAGLTFDAEKEVSIINYHVPTSMSSTNVLKCAQAHFNVMKINADKVGGSCKEEISFKLWRNAEILASQSDWKTAKKSVQLAVELNGRIPKEGSFVLKFLTLFSSYGGIVLREHLIRFFKRRS